MRAGARGRPGGSAPPQDRSGRRSETGRMISWVRRCSKCDSSSPAYCTRVRNVRRGSRRPTPPCSTLAPDPPGRRRVRHLRPAPSASRWQVHFARALRVQRIAPGSQRPRVPRSAGRLASCILRGTGSAAASGYSRRRCAERARPARAGGAGRLPEPSARGRGGASGPPAARDC